MGAKYKINKIVMTKFEEKAFSVGANSKTASKLYSQNWDSIFNPLCKCGHNKKSHKELKECEDCQCLAFEDL